MSIATSRPRTKKSALIASRIRQLLTDNFNMTPNNYGHYPFTGYLGTQFRLKFMNHVIRVERRSSTVTGWRRIASYRMSDQAQIGKMLELIKKTMGPQQ